MSKNDSHYFLMIRSRPWYIWLLRIVWLLWVIFWGEVALGSWKELELRAFTVALLIFLISLVLGLLMWLWGHLKFKKT